ncbi:Aminodeoxychorismate lyase [hydrothermal vent metagenome]|uniref:Aminodeoxychorismate lyase n=1 Tax=hydrothermal vent metagenome TaxID=652676 RepID=A0A3B1E971_9ZZZZ
MIYFETIKCKNKKIFHIKYHQKRIMKTVGLDISLFNYIDPPSIELLKCKVIYNKNGIINIEFLPYKQKKITSFNLITNNNIIYSTKSLNRDLIDSLYRKKGIAHEIIIIKNNLITDTSIANIAIYYDNIWITPTIPLLKGTTRARFIDEKKIIQRDITPFELIKSKKIALMNSMINFSVINDFKIINKKYNI